MSTKEVYTRAVYKFFDRATNDSLIFYKHHDGYPHGWFGALERIKAVLVLGAFNDLKVIKKVMLEVGAKELRDEMEADRVEQQHRYNVDLDDGQVTLTHYDWLGDKDKYHYILEHTGWKQRWMGLAV
jgi:hypothetical protein